MRTWPGSCILPASTGEPAVRRGVPDDHPGQPLAGRRRDRLGGIFRWRAAAPAAAADLSLSTSTTLDRAARTTRTSSQGPVHAAGRYVATGHRRRNRANGKQSNRMGETRFRLSGEKTGSGSPPHPKNFSPDTSLKVIEFVAFLRTRHPTVLPIKKKKNPEN